MPRNKTEDLRNHLFAALESLADTDDDKAIERAKAVANIAKEINASAKNEIVYLQFLAKNGHMPDTKEHRHLLGSKKSEE